jgi:hypothetical protein
MKIRLFVMAAAIAFTASSASAQVLDLTGRFRCIQNCIGGSAGPAFITQTGWDLNLVNEIGTPGRAWIDRPGHLWSDTWREGAIYSADGITIQFDRGTIWVRDLGPPPAPMMPPAPPPPLPPHKKHYHHPVRPLGAVGS